MLFWIGLQKKKKYCIGCIYYCDCQYCDIPICRYIAAALLVIQKKKHHMLLRRNGMHAQEYLRDTG